MRMDLADHGGSIKIYLREIGRTALLTPQQEIELAALIKQGDPAARELMIKANLRLVVKIAHDYSGLGLPLLDLISEGNIGLMKAVERFDPNKGGKLSTYSAWWIKQSMKRALANQGKTIRLPVHLIDKIGKLRRASFELAEKLGREPSDAELAQTLNVPLSRVVQLRTIGIRPASLDAPLGDEDGGSYGEMIGDEQASDPAETLLDKAMLGHMQEVLTRLPDRERTILTLRFGLNDDKQLTLEDIGAKLGVTRERVRQLQNLALEKMRRMIAKDEKAKSEPAAAEQKRKRWSPQRRAAALKARQTPDRPGFSRLRANIRPPVPTGTVME